MQLSSKKRATIEWWAEILRQEEDVGPGPYGHESLASRVSPGWRNHGSFIGVCGLIRTSNRRGGFPADRIDIEGDTVRLVDLAGHRWTIRLVFDADDRVTRFDVGCDLAGGLRLRQAGDEDYAELAALDSAAPIPVDGGHARIDRGGTMQEAIRLIGPGPVWLVCDGDAVLACCGNAEVDIRVGGEDRRVGYAHHLRVREDARRLGLVPVLAAATAIPKIHVLDGGISVAHSENRYAVDNRPHPWETMSSRLVLNCQEIASDPLPRDGGAADLDTWSSMINHAHCGQEWFRPYTEERLLDRLGRVPKAYSESNLSGTERAMIGYWPGGDCRTYQLADREWTEIRGHILDFGYTSGGLGDLERLVRATAGRALDDGRTHLSISCAPQAEAYPMLAGLAERVEDYAVSCIGADEPEGTAARGVAIDPTLL